MVHWLFTMLITFFSFASFFFVIFGAVVAFCVSIDKASAVLHAGSHKNIRLIYCLAPQSTYTQRLPELSVWNGNKICSSFVNVFWNGKCSFPNSLIVCVGKFFSLSFLCAIAFVCIGIAILCFAYGTMVFYYRYYQWIALDGSFSWWIY